MASNLANTSNSGTFITGFVAVIDFSSGVRREIIAHSPTLQRR
jgi:hypothetical protein